ACDIAASIWQLARDTGYDHSPGHACKARQSGHGCRRYTEKRHKQRIFRTQVHIGQIKKSDAFAQPAYHWPQSILPGHQNAIAKTGPAVQQDPVEVRTFLVGIHGHHVVVERNADAAHVQTDEVRGQHDERLAVRAIQIIPAFKDDEITDAPLAAPPQDAVFEYGP